MLSAIPGCSGREILLGLRGWGTVVWGPGGGLRAVRALGSAPGRAMGSAPGRALGSVPGRALGSAPGRAIGSVPGRRWAQARGQLPICRQRGKSALEYTFGRSQSADKWNTRPDCTSTPRAAIRRWTQPPRFHVCARSRAAPHEVFRSPAAAADPPLRVIGPAQQLPICRQRGKSALEYTSGPSQSADKWNTRPDCTSTSRAAIRRWTQPPRFHVCARSPAAPHEIGPGPAAPAPPAPTPRLPPWRTSTPGRSRCASPHRSRGSGRV